MALIRVMAAVTAAIAGYRMVVTAVAAAAVRLVTLVTAVEAEVVVVPLMLDVELAAVLAAVPVTQQTVRMQAVAEEAWVFLAKAVMVLVEQEVLVERAAVVCMGAAVLLAQMGKMGALLVV